MIKSMTFNVKNIYFLKILIIVHRYKFTMKLIRCILTTLIANGNQDRFIIIYTYHWYYIHVLNMFYTFIITNTKAEDVSWSKESYSSILKRLRQRETFDWGHPIVKSGALQSRAFSDCPDLEKGENVAEIICNKSTCMLKCEKGFIKVGRARTRCRFNKQNGIFQWGHQE